jgi:hypothetical protein
VGAGCGGAPGWRRKGLRFGLQSRCSPEAYGVASPGGVRGEDAVVAVSNRGGSRVTPPEAGRRAVDPPSPAAGFDQGG